MSEETKHCKNKNTKKAKSFLRRLPLEGDFLKLVKVKLIQTFAHAFYFTFSSTTFSFRRASAAACTHRAPFLPRAPPHHAPRARAATLPLLVHFGICAFVFKWAWWHWLFVSNIACFRHFVAFSHFGWTGTARRRASVSVFSALPLLLPPLTSLSLSLSGFAISVC